MNFKRIATCLLAGTIAISTLLTGCSKAPKINESATVITVNDGEETINLGYYYFVSKYQQAFYDISYASYFGDEMWTQDMGGSNGETFADSVISGMSDQLLDSYVSIKHAGDYGIEITDEEQAKIDEAAKAFMDANDKEALSLMGAKEEYVKRFLTESYYTTKVRNEIRTAAEVSVSDDEANQSTISYLFVSTAATTDEETGEEVPLTDEEIEAKRNEAIQAKDAADFEAKVEELGYTLRTYSYTKNADMSEYTLNEAVMAAAKSLPEGSISDVIEVEGTGFYVVRKDKEIDAEATENKRASIEDTKRTEAYNEILEGWKEEVTWTVDESQFANITFDPMFEMSQSMQDALTQETESTEGE